MPTDTAELFFQMSERLKRNTAEAFGGAFVVVPPAEGGDPLNTVIFDSKQDPAQFWMLLKTKCDIALGQLDQKQRAGQAFGRR